MSSLCGCVWGSKCHNTSSLVVPSSPLPHGALREYRHLCLLVEPRCVYCTLAGILRKEGDLRFASTMVQQLNIILFTSAELFEMRMQLKSLSTEVRPHM